MPTRVSLGVEWFMLETTLNYNPYAIIKELYIYIYVYIYIHTYIEIIEIINIVPPQALFSLLRHLHCSSPVLLFQLFRIQLGIWGVGFWVEAGS